MTMNGIERFLKTDLQDAGCAQTIELLHVYVDATLDGDEPERRHPGVAAHLRACAPCAQDCDGLLAAVTGA
jgi:hypothetical protein